MQKIDGKLKFSPSDLITFMDSKFDSWMDRWKVEFPAEVKADEPDESHALLQKLGNRHEDNFLEKLKAEGVDVAEIAVASTEVAELETIKAMRNGRKVIYQGVLSSGSFSGRTDFLYKVDGASNLGDFHYEVWDTKLAKKAKPYFVIQLCCYAEMLETIQGMVPKSISIILGDLSQKSFLTNDYISFYRQLKKTFLNFHESFSKDLPPEDCTPGTFSKWKDYGRAFLTDRDDLSLIANIRKVQIQKLKAAGLNKTAELASSASTSVTKMAPETFQTLKSQARLQLQTLREHKTAYEFLPAVAHKGFYLLPPASPGDVYFDMEGYPHIEDGLEYLFGAVYKSDGKIRFKDWWAHDRKEEKVAFEAFIDWVYARWQEDPGMHVYHYAPYEVSAARRLAGRHATRINEVDELLRHEVFVDFFQIVRQGLQVGEPSYSIKNVEHLYRDKRAGSVSKATDSVVFYEKWLETPDGDDWQQSALLSSIRDYNEEDCMSTYQLGEWLREVRGDLSYDDSLIRKAVVDADPDQATNNGTAAATLALELINEAEQLEEAEEKRVKQLVAGLLEFHVREQKPFWWEYFDRRKSSPDELFDDPNCLANLKRTAKPPFKINKSSSKINKSTSQMFEYEFAPDQETKIQEGDNCRFLFDSKTNVHVETIDRATGKIVLKLGPSAQAPSSIECIVLHDYVNPRAISDSIYRTVVRARANGYFTGALHDLLYKQEPKISGRETGKPITQSSDLNEIIDAISKMENSTLCIQGPPGCGKSYTASHAIVALLKQGKRVGITSNSHKVIEHLLEKVAEEARSAEVKVKGAKIAGLEPQPGKSYLKFGIEYVKDTKAFRQKKSKDYNLLGGTAWFYSDENCEGLLDYLFVDEAGQVCLANVVGMSHASKNIVLIGDQMQLEQPIRGSHPGETGQSALEYLIQDHATVPPNLGIFLGVTHRMHPELCKLISSAVYESRLTHATENERQMLVPGPAVKEKFAKTSGLIWVPVTHFGNTQSSKEEVEVIAEIVKDLLNCSVIDKHGAEHKVVLERDIIIVAPYNMQVSLIAQRIPGVQVASVDKFQGREAPIVILSMCASDGGSSPRGANFLFNKSRLNVAISRAQTLAFVVGHPELVKTSCSTLPQMHQLNLFCQIVEAGNIEQCNVKEVAKVLI
jgi:predicted RecB family nuclease